MFVGYYIVKDKNRQTKQEKDFKNIKNFILI